RDEYGDRTVKRGRLPTRECLPQFSLRGDEEVVQKPRHRRPCISRCASRCVSPSLYFPPHAEATVLSVVHFGCFFWRRGTPLFRGSRAIGAADGPTDFVICDGIRRIAA